MQLQFGESDAGQSEFLFTPIWEGRVTLGVRGLPLLALTLCDDALLPFTDHVSHYLSFHPFRN